MRSNAVTLEEATALFEKGSLGRAESACRRLLRKDRKSVSVLFLLALIHQEQKKTEEAIENYQQVIAVKPDIAEAYYNLGMLLNQTERISDAIRCYKKALRLKPNWEEAYNNLGKAYLDQTSFEEARKCFEKAIKLNSRSKASWLNLGNCILKSHSLANASKSLKVFQTAVELDPDSGQAHHNLGLVLEALDRNEEALKAFQRAVALAPTNKMWQYFLDIRLGTGSADELPAEYVTGLFDSYADNFDDHLVQQLEYHTPGKLYDVFTAQASPDQLETGLHILDLGCGTGLSGVLFHKHKESMTGIDLSEKMIDAAGKKSIYDELIVGDMHQVMTERPESFDLILSADVFVYVGDLNRTFEAVFKSLKPNGYFVFSVEKLDGDGFELGKTNRFRHSIGYLDELSSRHQFENLQIEEQILRKESGQGVVGYVAVLKKLDSGI